MRYRGATYDGDGVLADVLEPDKLEGAGAAAVNALGLVLSDDNVPQGRTRVQEEDGILSTYTTRKEKY